MATDKKEIALYKGKIHIEFTEASHRYIVKEPGARPLSVTACTGIIDKSRPLIYWATGLAKDHLLGLCGSGKKITEEDIETAVGLHAVRKEEAATIGSLVHAFAENHIKGVKQEIPEDPKVANGVIAFLKWKDENKIKFLASEQIVYSKKHGYVGIMDCKFTMGGPEKHKIIHAGDFKTSKAIYPEMMAQVSAYQEADSEESGCEYGDKWIIRFGKDDGEFEAKSYPLSQHKKDFSAFLGCLAVKKWLKDLT